MDSKSSLTSKLDALSSQGDALSKRAIFDSSEFESMFDAFGV